MFKMNGCLSSFLPDPHQELPEIKMLNLRDGALNKDDCCNMTYRAESSQC